MRTPFLVTLIVTLALSSLLACTTCPAHAANTPSDNPRTISTTGEAIVYVVPDEVIITFGVETFAPKLADAKAQNDDAAGRLVKAIKALGIEDKYISTDNLQLEIQYSDAAYRGRGTTRGDIAGYLTRRAHSVKLKDVKLADKLIAIGLENGANQLQGVVFQTTELRKYRDQARSMAAKAAQEKALLLAKELKVTVAKPRTITEGYSSGYFGGGRGGNSFMNAQANGQAEQPAGENSDALPLGQIAISANVSVTFDLAD